MSANLIYIYQHVIRTRKHKYLFFFKHTHIQNKSLVQFRDIIISAVYHLLKGGDLLKDFTVFTMYSF